MASNEDVRLPGNIDGKLGKSKSRSHRKHRDRSDASVTSEKSSRSKNGTKSHARRSHSSRNSVDGAASIAESVDSQASDGTQVHGQGKKSILKYMIHEVRELRRQLSPHDPGSRYGGTQGEDDESGDHTLNRTFPPSGSAVGVESQEGLMHTAPFMASIFRATAETNDPDPGEAVAVETGRHILNQLRT